jgi:hypothetical protein
MPSKINNVVFSDFLQEDRIKVEWMKQAGKKKPFSVK